MKFQEHIVTHRDGTEKPVQIGVPEDLAELVAVAGEELPYNLGLKAYMKTALRRAAGVRAPKLKLDIGTLSVEQIKALRRHGLLK